MQITVLDGNRLNPGDNPWTELERLGDVTVFDATREEEILERSAGAQILLTNKTPLARSTIQRLPELKFISVLATGYDVVDVAAARDRDIPVSHVPEYGTDSVAQHVLAMLLHFCNHCALHDHAIRRGEWAASGEFSFWNAPLMELTGKTLGIVGLGRIGRRVADWARALGMHVIAYDIVHETPPGWKPPHWTTLENLFAEADVVSLHCPQNPETAEIVNAEILARMKPTALLLNASRGGLINERDLAGALNAGRISGAGLDVLSSEPVTPDNPLLTARNCLLTPHTAWASLEARRRLMQAAVANVAAYLAGHPTNIVNA